MTPFEYRRASRVADAVAWLRETPDAKLLAGGQSLLAAMKLGLAAPPLLIDLGRVTELRALRDDGAHLWIGAMCTHAAVAASPLVRARLPGLARLASGIADQQVRNRGTLGGSVSNADPAACWPAGVLACGATLVTDRREMAADDFFQGLFATALEPDEVLLGVRFPVPDRLCYAKFEQPASRFAITGVAVARTASGVRVAITGLGHGPCRWPQAEAALAQRFAPVALHALTPDADRAAGDLHASAEYRLHLAGVLARRAVQNMVLSS
ncbi:FAD binding domain-containing protein [Hydrogenophaga sp. BPS33]|uniref:FAD binding domain-containing protein n=1 Tax=Hydrogenophaga sp. BPS33 TaxID=2651974 RepID=UPI00131FE437|nr:xanthine dehydrogenase family protein subunit M [Hydrogenophaga sp. BPS33]QHE87392.1 xanthine dehydrogenase family protein subunit M [Hydrogenophaga sp. BPS33]